LNFRRREINKFIEERLPQRVNEAFAHFAAHTEEEINRRMAELRRKIRENFGEQAVDANGTLKQEFRNTPLGQEYEQLSKQQADAVAVEDMKTRFTMIFTRFSVGITKMGILCLVTLQHTRAQVRHSLQRRGDQAVLGEQWAVLHKDGHIVPRLHLCCW